MGALDMLLAVQDYTDAVQVFEQEPSQTLFSDMFATNRKPCNGPTTMWDEMDYLRRLASVMGDDSPFPLVNPNDKKPQAAPLIHLKAGKKLSAYKLMEWRAMGMRDADVAKSIQAELKSLYKIIAASREYICAQALLGSIDTSQIEGSEYTVTFTYGVSTLAGGAWSNPATELLGTELPAIVQKYVAAAGREPGITIINDQMEQNLLKNTSLKAWAQQQYGANFLFAKTADAKVLNGVQLMGLDWYKSFGGYVPTGGAFTRFMPTNKILSMPTRDGVGDFLELAEGFGAIPVNAFGGGDASQAAANFRRADKPGLYAYSVGSSNPAGVEIYVGYRFFPVIKFAPGVLVTTTT